MKPTKVKRYNTEAEVIADIERFTEKMKHKLAESDRWYLKAIEARDELAKLGAPFRPTGEESEAIGKLQAKLADCQRESDRLKSAGCRLGKKLGKLKNALSEIRTPLLTPGGGITGPDRRTINPNSVVVKE